MCTQILFSLFGYFIFQTIVRREGGKGKEETRKNKRQLLLKIRAASFRPTPIRPTTFRQRHFRPILLGQEWMKIFGRKVGHVHFHGNSSKFDTFPKLFRKGQQATPTQTGNDYILCKRLESLGIMGAQLRYPLKLFNAVEP